MPITPTATRTGSYSVRYDWSGTAPFDVWRDGVKVLNQTDATTLTVQTTDGTTNPLPAVEILDSTDTDPAQSEVYSPRLRFQWRGQADASLYIVQQYTAGEWTTIQAVRESGIGYYCYDCLAQADGEDVQFRVLPQDSRGYQGLPISFTARVVCNPAPPAVAFTYDSGTGDVTAEDAA